MSVEQADGVFARLNKKCQELAKKTEAGGLRKMSSEDFSDFSDKVSELYKEVNHLLDNYHPMRSMRNTNLQPEPAPKDFDELTRKIDKLYSHIVKAQARRSVASRVYYAVVGVPTFKLHKKYLLLSDKSLNEELIKEREKIKKEWQDKIKKKFEVDPKASVGAKAGVEGRRWGTTYLLTDAQVEELERRKKDYDEIQATFNAYKNLGKNSKEAQKQAKYFLKATGSTALTLIEESVVTTGQAVMVGLGGPIYAGLVLAWNGTFGVLEKGGNFLSGIFARADAFIEHGIVKLFWKVPIKEGSVDWSTGNVLKNIGLGVLHSLRAPFFLSKILFSGVAAVARVTEESIGKFAKKNIIPLLGVSGTVIAAYFIAITLASVFTFGIPLAITAVGLTFAVAGAAIATYMRTKSKVQELASLKLSPEEEAMLMRYEYQHKPNQGMENRAQNLQVVGPELQQQAEIVASGFHKAQQTKAEVHKELPLRGDASASNPILPGLDNATTTEPLSSGTREKSAIISGNSLTPSKK